MSDATRFTSVDPRTGRVIGDHPVADEAAVGAAVSAARAVQPAWEALGFRGRRLRLRAWRRLILARADDLIDLIRLETGKPADDARLEVVLVTRHLAWAADNAGRVLRRRRVAPGLLMPNQAATLEYRALGVVGVIGPWNYPAFIPIGPVAAALAAGNTVVLKPSELTPRVGEWLSETLAEAVPGPRVLRVVTGLAGTGALLCRSGVDKISFTGSSATGRLVLAACAQTLTPAVIEGGGKDAMIVAPDADLPAAADAAVWAAMTNAGQTCVGLERVYVVDEVADEFLGLVVERAAALRAGAGADADLGPIVLPRGLDVIAAQLRDALSRGGRAVLGGEHSLDPPYMHPAVLADVPEESTLLTDETFGPVLVVNRVATTGEAIERANASRYGLGASVYSRRSGAAIGGRLRAGMVSVNAVIAFAGVPGLPFGGVGDSGFGRVHGPDGLREFARSKATTRQLFRPPLRPTSFTRSPRTMRSLVRIVRLLSGPGALPGRGTARPALRRRTRRPSRNGERQP
ncbi:aldehyde dehydrogenase family protein [Actinomadura graeca]|uniref:Aldehyde dehydrogenase n=1 Tax=Actinomadura graeca TaxID=2750812 RepID=A0ABX8QX18_9ACTN|nr:aldehyde dehydrogenase family protein [Actinomadura graeca]QXJ23395.1 aldehyde dehydrogenase family protein [Actinomadura graeca]